MESTSATVTSLALGAAMIATQAVNEAVKDAYTALERLIKSKYPKVDIELIEREPRSKGRRAVVEEELDAAGADRNSDLLAAAGKLIDAIQQYAPDAAQRIGLDLGDIVAARVRLSDVSVSEGVRITGSKMWGDIGIGNIVVNSDYKAPRSS